MLEWQDWSPLRAGLIYILLWLGLAHGARLAQRWLAARGPKAERVAQWQGWTHWGRVLGALGSLSYLAVLLSFGQVAARDVGLAWDLGLLSADLLAVGLAITAVVLALFWGSYWRRVGAGPRIEHGVDLVIHAVGHELSLAILRATLLPVMGSYWGIWEAPVLRMIVMVALPVAARHEASETQKRPARRTMMRLDWALDWLSSLIFYYTRSGWVALLGRVVVQLVVGLVAALVSRVARRRSAPAAR
jgi:hypothetical protein